MLENISSGIFRYYPPGGKTLCYFSVVKYRVNDTCMNCKSMLGLNISKVLKYMNENGIRMESGGI